MSTKTTSQIKILLAGTWQHSIYEQACADALNKLGAFVVPFKWASCFSGVIGKIEERYVIPFKNTGNLNNKLLKTIQSEKPDIVFIWRGTHIYPQTLNKIREGTNTKIISYNNDDPFSPLYTNSQSLHKRRMWNMYLKAIPYYDIHFAYRHQNINELKAAGAKNVRLLRSYFIPEIHKPIVLSQEERKKYSCDIAFIGHYEPERFEYIKTLLENGIKVNVYGSNKIWAAKKLGDYSEKLLPINEVKGTDYAKAVTGAGICLCFMSRLNRDTYTRRAFEIPACKGLLLSERTDDMQSLYTSRTKVNS